MADQSDTADVPPGWAAFESRDDLRAYGDNALLLFVAQMRLGFDDVDTFASNSLTDGSNDKKCDLVAVSVDKQRIVLAQGFMSGKTTAGEAPANKASDLNTAVSWLLAGDLDSLPETLRGGPRKRSVTRSLAGRVANCSSGTSTTALSPRTSTTS